VKNFLRRLLALGLLGVLGLAQAHNVSELAKQRMLDGDYFDFAMVGAEHMLTGYDHLLFLLGVLFFLKSFIDIVKFITAFTLGHTLVLIFATKGGVGANPYLIDAVIALTVIYKAFENLDGFRRWLHFNAPSLLWMVFAFGLIHGFGLSTRLQQMTLAKDPMLVSKVIAFNVGVELGQIAALTVMAAVIRLWRETSVWPLVSRAANTALICAGALLFVQQLQGYAKERSTAAALTQPASVFAG
jgi:hypothetical protein